MENSGTGGWGGEATVTLTEPCLTICYFQRVSKCLGYRGHMHSDLCVQTHKTVVYMPASQLTLEMKQGRKSQRAYQPLLQIVFNIIG